MSSKSYSLDRFGERLEVIYREAVGMLHEPPAETHSESVRECVTVHCGEEVPA